MHLETVIWDWNGTLLNDLNLCISSINSLLKKRALPILKTSMYKEVFSFPVKDYYALIGFDFAREEFEVPAQEFIDLYEKGVAKCKLHTASAEVLTYIKNQGVRQFVLSAMHQNMLQATLKHNKIIHFFESFSGLNDHYATSKVARGSELFQKFSIPVNSALMIGDTIHDFEVAQELGIKCILIADGHQSKSRLEATGAPVIDHLLQLIDHPLLSK